MRGKPPHGRRPGRPGRIIPAHAGQTDCVTTATIASSDHPRACGANYADLQRYGQDDGSSPRMRGKPDVDARFDGGERIIPAHAGQTSPFRPPPLSRSDHPRACGANVKVENLGTAFDGSSPRMRGKHTIPANLEDGMRIIPAHAGQTPRVCRRTGWGPDHPRACGANALPFGIVPPWTGSSPRMRGKRPMRTLLMPALRIIPAHAGQTEPHQAHEWTSSDHPRACGANVAFLEQLLEQYGSSPRMRGKREHEVAGLVLFRIIPAHAGQTVSASVVGDR